MKKPVLVIMAAGMGSRYGGMKQIDPVDEEGHIIMDFSIYDARRAGFEKVIFIIKKEFEKRFRESIGDRISEFIEVAYVYQTLESLPEGFSVPQGRQKPFGTGHAILCCQKELDGPFVVINADDYYGVHGFGEIYQYMLEAGRTEKYQFAMVGYRLSNTLTDHGSVSRGVCETDSQGYLTGITERIHMERSSKRVVFTEDQGATWQSISGDAIVSMNMFGFTEDMLKELKRGFPLFLKEAFKSAPLTCEYFLPTVVGELIKEGKATVKVLKSEDRWYGITYKEDKQSVVNAILRMKEQGIYPLHLWRHVQNKMY